MTRGARAWLTAIVVSGAMGPIVGCGHFDGVAVSYARAQEDALAHVTHGSAIARRICYASAVSAYLQMRLGLGRTGDVASPSAWATWYATEPAEARGPKGPISWADYCQALDATGAVYYQAVLALRRYGDAVAAFGGAQSFDASGLESLTRAGASAATTFGASSAITDAVSGVASPLASLGQKVGDELRTRELKSLVVNADPTVQAVLTALRAYVDALGDELTLAARRRDVVTRAVGARRDADGGLSIPAVEANAVGLARDDAYEEGLLRVHLEQYKKALDLVAHAHAALAAFAQASSRENEAASAIANLNSGLHELSSSREWEDN